MDIDWKCTGMVFGIKGRKVRDFSCVFLYGFVFRLYWEIMFGSLIENKDWEFF